jgi:hypothetical protein
MNYAQMIARAWLDERYRVVLSAEGIEVPPRPELDDFALEAVAGDDEGMTPVPPIGVC